MAALDFGMAKNRGVFAGLTPAMEQEVLRLSGGQKDVFKSEDFWSQQVDKLIKQGYKETTRVGPSTFGGRGTFDYKVRQKGYESATPIYDERYIRRSRGAGPQYLPISTPNVDPRRYMKQSYIVGYDAVKQRDLSQSELDTITTETKARTAKTKAAFERAKKEGATPRKARGAGGVLAKAVLPGQEGAGTGMPILGETGLGLMTSVLGAKQKLGA